jgi:putative nucleotidyltransferase with HDIG domain
MKKRKASKEGSMNRIPDEAACRRLMNHYAMLPNIVEHSYRVCQVARFLATALSGPENGLNPALIVASSLLHDITKTRSLKTKEDHAGTGGKLLESLGYPKVAEVVRGHVKLASGDALDPLREVHIINYADKRVKHHTVVSLEERFTDLMARYGSTRERIRRLEQMRETGLDLERKIFHRIDASPADLHAFNDLPPFDLETIPIKLQRA